MLCYGDGDENRGLFALDNSSRETWHKCRLKWWLSVYLGRTTEEIKKDLFCGECLHKAMERFYNGMKPEEVLKAFDQEYKPWAFGKVEVKDGKAWQNIREVLWRVLQDRVVNPPYQPVEGWVEFPVQYQLPGESVLYCGRVDAVCEANFGFLGEDTKSTGRPDEGWKGQFEMTDGFTGYYAALRAEHDWDVPNWYINVIHAKALPAEPKKKCSTHKRPWEECWYQHNESRTIGPYLRDPGEIPAFERRVVEDAHGMEDLIGRAPTLQDIEEVPATGKISPRTACDFCEFRPFCVGRPATADQIAAHTTVKFWDPREVK